MQNLRSLQPLQKLGIFYCYFNATLQSFFYNFFMLEPAILYLFLS